MKLVLYAKPLEDVPAAVAIGLAACDHSVSFAQPKYFHSGEKEDCQAVIIFPDLYGGWESVIETYLAVGIPVYSLGGSLPPCPGYCIAGMSHDGLLDPACWEVIGQSTPDSISGPTACDLRLSYYPAVVPLNEDVAEMARTLQARGLSNIVSPGALKKAPRVIILGGGPGLKDFNYDLLRGEVVIGANRAFQSPNVGMMVSMDERFWRWAMAGQLPDVSAEEWANYGGFKVFTLVDGAQRWEDTTIVKRVIGRDVFPPELDLFGITNNSGYCCLLTAWAMGAREIWMVGFDLKGEGGKQSWHHSGYPTLEPDDSVYHLYRKDFERAAPALAKAGVKVTVFGDTTLTCFKTRSMQTLKRQLKKKAERPLIVNFATEDTRYVAEAAKMTRSARFFGLVVDDCINESYGGWQANTYQKAEFIAYELKRFDRAIVWLDADSEVKKYPIALDEFAASDCDVAVAYIDWDKVPGSRRHGSELDSAVLGFRPTEAAFALLERWREINSKRLGSGVFEQKNLQDAIKEMEDLRVFNLPMDHCQIFDSMASLGHPVIVQNQASRTLKAEVGP